MYFKNAGEDGAKAVTPNIYFTYVFIHKKRIQYFFITTVTTAKKNLYNFFSVYFSLFEITCYKIKAISQPAFDDFCALFWQN